MTKWSFLDEIFESFKTSVLCCHCRHPPFNNLDIKTEAFINRVSLPPNTGLQSELLWGIWHDTILWKERDRQWGSEANITSDPTWASVYLFSGGLRLCVAHAEGLTNFLICAIMPCPCAAQRPCNTHIKCKCDILALRYLGKHWSFAAHKNSGQHEGY